MRPDPKFMYNYQYLLMNMPNPYISIADFTVPVQMMHAIIVPYALKVLHFAALKISFLMIKPKPVSRIVASTPVH